MSERQASVASLATDCFQMFSVLLNSLLPTQCGLHIRKCLHKFHKHLNNSEQNNAVEVTTNVLSAKKNGATDSK
jgi:hypothetical protein